MDFGLLRQLAGQLCAIALIGGVVDVLLSDRSGGSVVGILLGMAGISAVIAEATAIMP